MFQKVLNYTKPAFSTWLFTPTNQPVLVLAFPNMDPGNDDQVARAREMANIVQTALGRKGVECEFDENLGSGEFPIQGLGQFGNEEESDACYYIFHPHAKFGGEAENTEAYKIAHLALEQLTILLTPSDDISQQMKKLERFRSELDRGMYDDRLENEKYYWGAHAMAHIVHVDPQEPSEHDYGHDHDPSASNPQKTLQEAMREAILATVQRYNLDAAKKVNASHYADMLAPVCEQVATSNKRGQLLTTEMEAAIKTKLTELLGDESKGIILFLTGEISDAIMPLIGRDKERKYGK
jgi:hypothetical protein